MDAVAARTFATEWIAAWNAHDLERILAFCSEDFTMTSPKIVTIAGDPSGTLHGKAAVRAYWGAGLQQLPELRFDLVQVLAGLNSLTLYYNSHTGQGRPDVMSAEMLLLNAEGKAIRGFAHYGI